MLDFSRRYPRSRHIAVALSVYPPLLLAVGVVLWLTLPAWPHQAPISVAQPEGWTYPYSCCSGIDCRPVPESAVSERPDGYVIKATGEVIPYGDRRVKDSPDGDMHWCSVAGREDSRTICLFVPPRSF
jgi:hypothetical protein